MLEKLEKASEARLLAVTSGQTLDDFLINPTTPSTFTETAHIIPFKLSTWKNDREQKKKMVGWQALFHMFPSIRETIKVASISSLSNMLTLEVQDHIAFGKLLFGLQHIASGPTLEKHKRSTNRPSPEKSTSL